MVTIKLITNGLYLYDGGGFIPPSTAKACMEELMVFENKDQANKYIDSKLSRHKDKLILEEID